jgi:2-keto-4-pentenoate hydratase/2-oxohepta-3-ene-1,7-dioic acid hydratase in catechol pathway
MRFVMFEFKGTFRPGVLLPKENMVADISANGGPRDLIALIEGGKEAMAAATAAAATGSRRALSDIRLLAPFPSPRRNIMCVGKNYREHSKEFHNSGFDATSGGQEIPESPVIFTKATTSVIGPGDPIPATSDPSGSPDYEGELAVVIGTAGHKISKQRALDHVCGYTIVNDVTARNLQQRHKQWFLGKSLDGFCPMGPVFVTADEIGEVTRLNLTTRVNGEVRQSACVKDLIFDIPTIIETLSSVLTLIPGDIIATGTPAGVGIGFNPPKFLKAGDTVSVEIDRIGVLENPVT